MLGLQRLGVNPVPIGSYSLDGSDCARDATLGECRCDVINT